MYHIHCTVYLYDYRGIAMINMVLKPGAGKNYLETRLT
jgi:hypothetical protein